MDREQQQPQTEERIPHERELGPVLPMPMIVTLVFCLALLGGALWFGGGLPALPDTANQTASVAQSIINVPIQARAAIVYDAKTQRVLFAKNVDAQLPLASLTKVMLSLVAVETLRSDAHVQITPEALSAEGDTGLRVGESWALQDLIDATLIPSSNDGAQALAFAIGNGDMAPAVSAMNKHARELAMTQTYFLNTTGLDESPTMAGAFGSARDYAKLLSYIVERQPTVLDGTTRDGMLLASEGGTPITAVNTNEALGQIPGLIGGKTGLTDLAGGNIAVAFDADLGHPIIIVVLGSTQEGRFDDVRTLVRSAREALVPEL